MQNIAVIGSGSWGMALSVHLAKLGHNIKVWSFADEEVDLINNNRICKFLPNVAIPNNIIAFTNFEKVIKGSDIIIHVTPSKFVRDTVKQYKSVVENQPIIICSKGFEANTLLSLADVIKEELPNNEVAVLSGPSHAEEVSIGVPTAIVIASENNEIIKLISDVFSSNKMRIYSTHDIMGVEIGSAFKNIVAFCAGILVSLNAGDNTFAALITRGLAEIARLGVAMGADLNTFYGLTGLGDLIVTCSSEHSRNRKAGKLIGQGKSLEETKKEVGMVIESIDNIDVAYKLAQKYNVEMPIVETAYNILYNNLNPVDALNILMTRKLKMEND